MSIHSQVAHVLNRGLVAIIRSSSSEQLVQVTRALYEGGIDTVEVTFTVPGVLDIIAAVKKDLGKKILLGAGTVLDPETARMAFLAGAEFLVSPTLNLDVIRLGSRYDKLVMPGVFSPTEVLTAVEAGAPIVKVFPADVVGPAYLKALHGPLPHVRLMPTGGVNLETLETWVKAGACAVGLGSALVEQSAIQAGDMNRISTLAAAYVSKLKEIRGRLANPAVLS